MSKTIEEHLKEKGVTRETPLEVLLKFDPRWLRTAFLLILQEGAWGNIEAVDLEVEDRIEQAVNMLEAAGVLTL